MSDFDHRKFVGGAMPPPNLQWQMGKTVASIRFVGDAQHLSATGDLPYTDAQRLREAIDGVMSGQLVFTELIDPKDWLAQSKQS